MKQRLWWLDDEPDPTDEKLIPTAELARWFKGAAKTFASTSEAKIPPAKRRRLSA
jgi:hypothetical protein